MWAKTATCTKRKTTAAGRRQAGVRERNKTGSLLLLLTRPLPAKLQPAEKAGQQTGRPVRPAATVAQRNNPNPPHAKARQRNAKRLRPSHHNRAGKAARQPVLPSSRPATAALLNSPNHLPGKHLLPSVKRRQPNLPPPPNSPPRRKEMCHRKLPHRQRRPDPHNRPLPFSHLKGLRLPPQERQITTTNSISSNKRGNAATCVRPTPRTISSPVQAVQGEWAEEGGIDREKS